MLALIGEPTREPTEERGAAAGAPLVCGALGSFDRTRVERAAEALGGGRLAPVHEDDRSILMLDREPLRWRGEGSEGFGWSFGGLWSDGPGDWHEAARRGGLGLVIEGRKRFLHSSIDGLLPIYWMEDGRAAYFASRIDPLVRAAPSRLSVDWDAWASIILLRFPLGEHTPFAEIRRLEPFSVLRRRFGRFRGHSPSWPWADIEPTTDLREGTEGVLAGL
jgi:hypothetical protein